MIIAALGKVSPNEESIIESLLQLTGKLIKSGEDSSTQVNKEHLDLTLISWLLLMLSYVLDSCVINGKSPVTDFGNGKNLKSRELVDF